MMYQKIKTKGKRAFIVCALFLTIAVLIGATYQRVKLDGEAVYDSSSDAVFYVRTLTESGALKTTGSGFAITKDGIALTAAHAIKDNLNIHIVLPSGEEIAGVTVLEQSPSTDIAVLKLPLREEGYAFLEIDTEIPRSGQKAYAIGYPLKTTKIITDGIVSSPNSLINGTERMLVSTDLANGMSGGPIINQYGTVIGMASATLRTMNGISTSPTTVQLINTATKYLDNQPKNAVDINNSSK